MIQTIVAVLLCCLSLTASASSPADGAWTFTMTSPMGSVEATVSLASEGDRLTGTFDLGGGRTWPVDEGTIAGNDIAFVLNRDRPSGGSMAYEMKGTVKDDTITGTASAMGNTVEWVMTRVK